MKLAALSASAMALALAFTSPARAELAEADKNFVMINTVVFAVIASDCPYKLVEGENMRLADRNGVDSKRMVPALVAAFFAQTGNQYDRDDLIPEVTSAVRPLLMGIMKDMATNKGKACRDWGKAVLPSGLIQAK
jgi:hypothetical protein